MSSNIRLPKICQFCGVDFIAKTTVTKYCGDNCAQRAYKKPKREEKIKSSTPVAIQKKKATFLLKTSADQSGVPADMMRPNRWVTC